MSTEEWRWIPGQEGFYEVSSLGRVRSVDREFTRADGRRQFRKGRMLTQTRVGTPRRYWSVTLRYGARRTLHTLVCETFHGPKPSPRHLAAHWDDNPDNNTATNIRWATPAENTADSRRLGSLVIPPGGVPGESNPNAVLTWPIVAQIRAERSAGVPVRTLVARYGIGKTQIHNIINGTSWRQEWRP